MERRLIFGAILLFSVLFLPFWISGSIALVGIIIFPIYLEAIILMMISDLLYGAGEARYLNILFLSTYVSIVLLLAMEAIKKRIKFYQS